MNITQNDEIQVEDGQVIYEENLGIMENKYAF